MDHLLAIAASAIRLTIQAGGYGGIVFLMALESACIPLPSEAIMPFAGALTLAAISAPRAPMTLPLVALAGAIGCALGSIAAWWVGAALGREWALRYGRYVLINRRDVEMADRWFQRGGGATVFVARLLPVVRTFISLPAGVARMRFGPFVLLSFLGSLPWCYLLAWLGVQFASRLDALKPWFHRADLGIGVLILVCAAAWIRHHVAGSRLTEAA